VLVPHVILAAAIVPLAVSVKQSVPGFRVVRHEHEEHHSRRSQKVPHQDLTESDRGDNTGHEDVGRDQEPPLDDEEEYGYRARGVGRVQLYLIDQDR